MDIFQGLLFFDLSRNFISIFSNSLTSSAEPHLSPVEEGKWKSACDAIRNERVCLISSYNRLVIDDY